MALDNYDPTIAIQLEIIKNEIQGWKNGAYSVSLRARIAKKLGDEEDAKRNQTELEKIYKRIDLLEEERKGIEAQIELEKAKTVGGVS